MHLFCWWSQNYILLPLDNFPPENKRQSPSEHGSHVPHYDVLRVNKEIDMPGVAADMGRRRRLWPFDSPKVEIDEGAAVVTFPHGMTGGRSNLFEAIVMFLYFTREFEMGRLNVGEVGSESQRRIEVDLKHDTDIYEIIGRL